MVKYSRQPAEPAKCKFITQECDPAPLCVPNFLISNCVMCLFNSG